MTAVLAAAVALLIVAGRSGGPPAPAEVPRSPTVEIGSIEVEGPETVDAGDDWALTISGVEPGSPVTAVIDTGYGLRSLTATPDSSTLELAVPADEGPSSGTVVATVSQADRVTTTTVEIAPGPVVGPIDVYLGPRTVIADAEHVVMIVAVPEDRFGNPVSAGTPVDFTTTRPNLVTEEKRYETAGLLAWYEVFSRTVTGRTRIATQSEEAVAPERSFLEVAGLPVTYGLELLDPVIPADGQTLLTIRTDVLTDRFGNVLPDGTVAVLDAEGVTGNRRINSQTVDGRVEFTLEVPNRPGNVTVVATASGVQSLPLEMSFESAVASMDAEIEVLEDRTLVRVGPITSVRGSFVPEGTTAVVTAADGTTVTVELSLGEGSALFPPSTDVSSATVEVLGSDITVRRPG